MPPPEPPRDGSRLGQLAAIGIAGGAFSGLFGVGGGAVMVPLLVLWRGLNEKIATGTSLLAIVLIATVAVIGHAIFGSVDVLKGVLIGVPAIGGVIAGTTLQQHLSDRLLAGMFSVLCIVVAVIYVVE
ncbi:MAG TPA: sulfite exporter TauE/SafE family protein [Solirubrobacterales bacterium]|jgi:uncharacterized membrane protein YfcA|nr:sulfite exporter TauE/SafE family protein [Solirubrobacterales bacterium]